MTQQGFFASTVDRVLSWSRSNSLWYYSIFGGCCADEVMQAASCRYDLERFGCLEQAEPAHADLLIISGAITHKMAKEVVAVYQKMPEPKYVIAVGACACSGGIFQEKFGSPVVPGIGQLLPVDVYVPGCPPRPEAIMNGLVNLQDKIMGRGQKK